MATPKKTQLEKIITKFESLLNEVRTELNKKDLDLPTKALYKRLIISLKTAENRVKIDKGAVDRVAKKRKKAAPKPKVAAKPKAKKEEQPTGKTKEG